VPEARRFPMTSRSSDGRPELQSGMDLAAGGP
jgi:hypothetical protein